MHFNGTFHASRPDTEESIFFTYANGSSCVHHAKFGTLDGHAPRYHSLMCFFVFKNLMKQTELKSGSRLGICVKGQLHLCLTVQDLSNLLRTGATLPMERSRSLLRRSQFNLVRKTRHPLTLCKRKHRTRPLCNDSVERFFCCELQTFVRKGAHAKRTHAIIR